MRGTGVEGRPHQPAEGVRLLQVGGVAAPGQDHGVGVGADGGRHPLSRHRELGVELARHQQHGHLQLAQPSPQRLLGADAQRPQGGRQPLRRVGPPAVQVVLGRREGGEHALRQPSAEERDGADPLDVVGQLPVGRQPGGALGGGGDAGRAPHQHQPPDQVGTFEGQPQAQPGPHRVADIDAPAPDRADGGRGVVEAHPDGRRAAVAGEVDPHHLEPGGEQAGHLAPRPARLGEPVDQGEPGSGALDRSGEHPPMMA